MFIRYIGFVAALSAVCGISGVSAAPVTAVLKGEFHEELFNDPKLASIILADDSRMVASAATTDDSRKTNDGSKTGRAPQNKIVIVGVVDASVLNGAALRELAISPGLNRGDEVCLTVISRDGFYTAANSFVVPQRTQPGQIVTFPYKKSRYLKQLSSYEDTELSVTATAGACDARATEHYLVHHTKTGPITAIRLFINSLNATNVYASTSGPLTDCKPIIKGRHTSFDFLCNVILQKSDKRTFSVTVKRERFGRELPPASISIRHGD